MITGTLIIYASVADQAAPLAAVRITVQDESGTVVSRLTTDSTGATTALSLPAPDARYSLDEDNRTVRPYSIYRLTAESEGWQSQILEGVQVFADQQTVARLSFLPVAQDGSLTPANAGGETVTTIPPHVLFAGNGGSGPTPEETLSPRVLTEVVIPKQITVHLGAPTASATNVTVGFQDYIANVASSEVYPTWPEEALRANILAQISLALNRIWTEWYPSRGYAFNITGSPSYDQAYVSGRTVFAVMEKLTAELFNTYVRRSGDQEPYFTEYCDGKLVTCPGMKQWGTVDRANEGKNALQILRYYYGDRVQLATTNNIASIPSSWPGVTLKRGSTGTSVSILQRQLSRIAKDYPAFGKPEVTGTFDAATEQSVKNFQKQFSLTADGLVGKATWYKISFIYVSVKDLGRAYQRRGNRHGHREQRQLARCGVAARLQRQRCGTGAILAVRTCPIQQRSARPDRGRFFWGRHRKSRQDFPARARTDGRRRGGSGHLGCPVCGLAGYAKRPGRYRLARRGPASGRHRHGSTIGPVLATAGIRQLQRPVGGECGRQFWCCHRKGRHRLPESVWSDGRRSGGAHHLEQTERSGPGRGQRDCTAQRGSRAVHHHRAGGQPRHGGACRTILSAAVIGLLQRYSLGDSGRQ